MPAIEEQSELDVWFFTSAVAVAPQPPAALKGYSWFGARPSVHTLFAGGGLEGGICPLSALVSGRDPCAPYLYRVRITGTLTEEYDADAKPTGCKLLHINKWTVVWHGDVTAELRALIHWCVHRLPLRDGRTLHDLCTRNVDTTAQGPVALLPILHHAERGATDGAPLPDPDRTALRAVIRAARLPGPHSQGPAAYDVCHLVDVLSALAACKLDNIRTVNPVLRRIAEVAGWPGPYERTRMRQSDELQRLVDLRYKCVGETGT